MTKILLAGESWVTSSTHVKGFDQFATATYATGGDALIAALRAGGHDVTFMPAHEAQRDFPQSVEALAKFDVLILSDIGANTLLLHPDTFIHSKTTPNRLKVIRDYVAGGGGLIMCGGYYSFQGINGGARYARTPVEEVLPVKCLPVDDRVEVPEGATASVKVTDHPMLAGLGGNWPVILGFNEVATVGSDYSDLPLLVTGTFGKGRSVAWTSDVGPHWLPPEFLAWDGYAKLFGQMIEWAAGKNGAPQSLS